MLVLFCQTCCKGSTTYRKWITHLFSTAHQKKIKKKIKDWSKKLQSQAVVFTEFCKPMLEIGEDTMVKLAWSVSEHTIISDLYFNCYKKACLILIDEKKGADYIVNMDEIKAGIYRPVKRLATDISENEWESILSTIDISKTLEELSSAKKGIKILNGASSEVEQNNVIGETESAIEIESDDEREDQFNAVDVEIEDDDDDEVSIDDDDDEMPIDDEDDEMPIDDDRNHASVDQNCIHETDTVTKTSKLERKLISAELRLEFNAIIQASTLSYNILEKRKSVISELEILFREHYNNAKVIPLEQEAIENFHFLETSSLVVRVDITGSSLCRPSQMSKIDKEKVWEIMSAAQLKGNFCWNLEKKLSQKRLFIKFTHLGTFVECECFFFMTAEQEKLQLTASYMNCDPRVLQLTKFLVNWYENSINEATSNQYKPSNKWDMYYPFIQLIIFFLIRSKFVPKPKVKRNGKKGIVTEVPAKPKSRGAKTATVTGILTMAKGFFDIFRKRQLNDYIVSLPTGKLIKKSTFEAKGRTKRQNKMNRKCLKTGKLREAYCKFIKENPFSRSIPVFQDAFDGQIYIFTNVWSPSVLSKLKELSRSASLLVENILAQKSSPRNLWSFLSTNR